MAGRRIGEAGEITRTRRAGLIAMAADAALDASLRRDAGDPLIFAADFDRLRVFFLTQGTPTRFRVGERRTTDDGDHFRPSRSPELVRTELAATLHLGDSASVDLSTSLIDLGVDSLFALDLRRRLRRASATRRRWRGCLAGSPSVN